MSEALTAGSTTSPWRSRIGSLVAIVPLSIWVVNHLWDNLAAFSGGQAWKESVTEYPHPVAHLITSIVVLLPLVLHTIWGVGRLLTTRPNNVRYGFFANLKYLLQRLSAVGVLLFVGAHLWLAMLKPRLIEGHAETFADISNQMHNHKPTLIVYVLGTLGVAYHLANGIATFAMGWGIVSSKIALKRVDVLAAIIFVVLLGMSWAAIWALWQAGGP
jgi:succinate dehydrogenase / fumarate reductase cytochrome b subunit